MLRTVDALTALVGSPECAQLIRDGKFSQAIFILDANDNNSRLKETFREWLFCNSIHKVTGSTKELERAEHLAEQLDMQFSTVEVS